MRRAHRREAFFLLLGLLAGSSSAPGQSEVPGPIRDNSFLVEEAYNQEDHVVQHISSFTFLGPDRDWLYSYTEEWPVGGRKNQISYTVTLADPGELEGATGAGDSLVNYRYQAVGGGPERIAFAPRLSLLLPTGSEKEGRGLGGFGLFLNLPLSVEFAPWLAGSSNAGAARVFSARDASENEANLTQYFLGQSLIWLARSDLNVSLEAVWSSEEDVVGPGTTQRFSSFFVTPGLSWAINRTSGLQVVPGVGVSIGAGSSKGEEALFLYVSFEHPFGRKPSGK